MYENLDDAFKDLKYKKYAPYAQALAAYRDSLLDEGFTRREATELLKLHTKYMYDRAFEAQSLADLINNDELTKEDFEGDDGSTP